MVFHVLNRGVGRRVLFTKDEDFLAFERVVDPNLVASPFSFWLSPFTFPTFHLQIWWLSPFTFHLHTFEEWV